MKSLHKISLAICLALSLSSCFMFITSRDFDLALNSILGKTAEEVRWPALDHPLGKRQEGDLEVIQYSLTSNIAQCRWELRFARDTGKILAWSYPDEKAKYWCSQILSRKG